MKKHIIYIVVGTILAINLVGCTDLEENLIGEITEEIGDRKDVDCDCQDSDRLRLLYAELRYAGTANHGGYYSIQEVTTDEMVVGNKGGEWYDQGLLIQLHQHTYTPHNDYISRTFKQTYLAIATINEELSIENWFKPEEIAQARALRAYFYWRLLDLYGRVKIITETNPDPPQASREEVYHFVESELLAVLDIAEVSESMDLTNSLLADDDSAYIINRYGALGLLTKLYLNAEIYAGRPMYKEAEIIASYIIDSGIYQLCGEGCKVRNLGKRPKVETDPEELEGYAAVFAPNNEGNPEHIFSVMYDEVSAMGMNFSQMNLHFASQLSWHLEEQPWNGYATLEEFYNAYEEQDARKQANFLAGPQFDFEGAAVIDYISNDCDVQLNYTPQINELTPNCLREAGARPAKFSFKLFGRAQMDNDFPIVRLGEMYLTRAEAVARQTGNWSDAEPDVNILRARAGVVAYNGNLTEEEFLAERGREMFQETARRTDLIRFGKYNEAWWEKPPSEPFRNVFPIPQLPGLGSGWTQNPGY